MTINNADPLDINEIFTLYEIAANYQKEKKIVNVWPNFDRKMVANEILENRQFKLLVDGEIACIWAITFSDEQIWEERNKDKALYIHRIAVNPNFRGNKYVELIVHWARKFVQKKDIQYIRLDTLGENAKLIKHYQNAGFKFLGLFNLKDTSNLPDHYKKDAVSLFEINIRKSKKPL
jgi:ribosomal protein S18 acetylase RimI-like enzyme